ncbi:MAG: SapC family protein [Gammaproteobacteria bacterium]|jgi:hypothetical protein
MKNAANIETIDVSRHAKLRVKSNPDFVHAKGANLASISLGEISVCASNYPIVFINTPNNNSLHPVALMGLRPGENVYYDKDGWDSTYVPRMIQSHPFLIAFDDRKDDSVMLTACLDRSSPFLGETDGVALFTEAGEETDFVKAVNQVLHEIFESEKMTDQFTRKMEELGLISQFDLLLQPLDAEPRKITGMYSLNETKLRELPPEQILELHKLDMLPVCYLMLGSLMQLPNLMKLRNKKVEEKIIDYRIEQTAVKAAE